MKISRELSDIFPVDDVIEYVKEIHGMRDFKNGKLYKALQKHSHYQVEYVDISLLNIHEYYKFEWLVEKYVTMYKSNSDYPPIVVSGTYRIIDGNHRANALYRRGLTKIKAFKGI